MMLAGDRFLQTPDGWFDVATAERVALSIVDAGSLRAQIAWAERCAMLAWLRHPLLNPLIDYGTADRHSFFEAYAREPPLTVTHTGGARLVTHAGRFLDAHGVTVTTGDARVMFRAMRIHRASPAVRRVPIGFVLQPRRAYEYFAELLSHSPPGGLTVASIAGPPGSGVRTLRIVAARMARAAGYVPVCAAAVARWPQLAECLAGRHVCLLTEGSAGLAERAIVARLLTALGTRSARPHLCIRTQYGSASGRGSIQLDLLGITAMTTMTYVDRDYGPSSAEVFEAARRAEGNPGRFLWYLRERQRPGPGASRHGTVHESAVPYELPPAALGDPPPSEAGRSRLGSVLWRARSRARTLQRSGRHAAAARLLDRAARALDGRGERLEAGRCWLDLGWLMRSRGSTARAVECADLATRAGDSPEIHVASACLRMVCWSDDGRLREAEAGLRSVSAAAAEVRLEGLRRQCVLALARTLFWQGRSADVPELMAPLIGSEDPELACEAGAMRARALAAIGDVSAAVHAAREAERRAGGLSDPRLRAAVSRALADALRAAGDVEGVRVHVAAGLAAAAAAHLPLTALSLRGVLLAAMVEAGESADATHGLRDAIARALRHPVPPLLRTRLEAALAAPAARPAGPKRDPVVAHLEAFLDIAQRQKDDGEAVAGVAAAVMERLGAAAVAVVAADGRVLAAAGRPWREGATAAAQAVASGQSVGAEDGRQPPEWAEPVRCGGQVVAAIAARWILGATVSSVEVTPALRAASMAIATHVRGVLEAAPAEPPGAAWNDLLGDSAAAISLRDAIQRASRAPFPVLIEGESGSGKELVARAIHRLSPRHGRRFCAINCAALSDELVEAELFGHARGAFTGAMTERAGLFEEADGGTLFLDEIGELSARAQAKLLRVLQEGEVRRVGENLPRRVDVRVVAATNRRLEHEAAHGRFRTDLRFRLDVLRIVVPPLRERVGDVPLLARHFWREACARVGSQAILGPDALTGLARYDWPGNVRELQNAIAWIAVHAPRRGRVSSAMLPAQFASNPIATGSFEAAREDFERRYVRAALAQAGGHRQAAAKALGISRQGLAKMLKRLGIDST